MIMIMHTKVGQVIYVTNTSGGFNVFTLPLCRNTYSCTVKEALDAVQYFLRTGVALKIEYQNT
jgi:hypothetical protein